MVPHISLCDQLLLLNNSIVVDNNLFNLSIFVFNSHNFLLNNLNFLDLFLNQWDFNRSVSENFNKFVHLNENRDNVLNCHKFLNFNWLVYKFFNFLSFDNLVSFSNNFLNISVNWNDLLYFNIIQNDFFFKEFHLFNFCLNIRNNFLNFSNLFLIDWD